MCTKYDKIGNNYNLTRKADPYIAERFIKLLNPKLGKQYLDIGCGTGNYTKEFANKGFCFIGIDPSKQMLDIAQSSKSNIVWKIGSAESTGLKPESIDGIIGSLTIHHWGNLEKGFKELYSILKPNGNIVIFTSTPQQMQGYWLNHYFSKMLNDSIKQMPTLKSVFHAMLNTGFKSIKPEKYTIKPDLKDLFLYSGKHNPELYFDAKIRHGISSFSSLSNKKEVDKGLEQMRQDIDNNTIQDIIKSYENNNGDYLFVVARK